MRGEGKKLGVGRGGGREEKKIMIWCQTGIQFFVLPELANAYSSLVSIRHIGLRCGTEDYTLLVAVFIDQGSSKLQLGSYN